MIRTDELLEQLCERLEYNCGDLHEAARFIGVSPSFVTRWIKEDTVAAEKVSEARKVGYGALESEAIRRAVVGVQKDVYYKGEVVGQQVEYSDGLLTRMLEARVTEFKRGEQSGTTFNGPTQINIMPRANNYEEWLQMREATLAKRDEQEALPAPSVGPVPEILTGDYVDYVPIGAPDKPLAGLEGLL